ncbi:Nucleotide-binding, alpha-beta plait [Moelleriella libera RCEF 2490]|uniref:Nucleotide-binding, alpha-beta plait n=1 Tax=Moelleriella libera RCEF 2490 TaxID=1081109 RepID=A0A166UUH3_9HYPO|nr:Nucleotide-binding, alpha-beta plait [Moelleriella libera RCEF 2490]
MNKIRAIQELNKKELEQGISPEASWHADYRDTAFIYFGGLPYDLTEGDIITIFSQFGEPCFIKLARDKETGKSKGFGWLKYEDQRSTDLAVDNLGGADIAGRKIGVDHARYKARDDDEWAEFDVSWEAMMRREGKWVSDEETDEEEARPQLPEETELQRLIRDHDDDDPMKAFLVEEKKKEVDEARRRAERKERKERKHRHRDRSREGRDRRHKRERGKDRSRERDKDSRRDRDHERRRHRSPDSRSKRSRQEDDDRKRGRSRSRSPRPHRRH